MSVVLRKRKNKTGTVTLRLDIHSNGKRWVETLSHLQLCKPANAADREMPRNLNISFNNNTQIPIDIMVFSIYLDKIVLNVQTGQLNKI
jgi:hypothetical protein